MRKILIVLGGLAGALALAGGAALLWMPWAGWQLSYQLIWQGPELYQKVPVTQILEDGTTVSVFRPRSKAEHVAVVSLGLLGTPDTDDRPRLIGNALANLGYLVVVPHGNAGLAPVQMLLCEGVARREAAIDRALSYAQERMPGHKVLVAALSAGSREALAAAAARPDAVGGMLLLNPFDDFAKLIPYTLHGTYPDAGGVMRQASEPSPVRKMMETVLGLAGLARPEAPVVGSSYSDYALPEALQELAGCWNLTDDVLARLRGVPAAVLGATADNVVPPAEADALAARLGASRFSTGLANHFQLLPHRPFSDKLTEGWAVVRAVRAVVRV